MRCVAALKMSSSPTPDADALVVELCQQARRVIPDHDKNGNGTQNILDLVRSCADASSVGGGAFEAIIERVVVSQLPILGCAPATVKFVESIVASHLSVASAQVATYVSGQYAKADGNRDGQVDSDEADAYLSKSALASWPLLRTLCATLFGLFAFCPKRPKQA